MKYLFIIFITIIFFSCSNIEKNPSWYVNINHGRTIIECDSIDFVNKEKIIIYINGKGITLYGQAINVNYIK